MFPTFYQNENQPVNLIEAMAYGLPVITTRWRSLPEMLPANYSGLVDSHSPQQIADALEQLMLSEAGDELRKVFVRDFALDSHLAGLAAAFHSIEHPVEDFTANLMQRSPR